MFSMVCEKPSDIFSQILVHGVDVVEQFVTPCAGGGTGDEVRRQFFPGFLQLCEIGLHFGTHLYLRQLVSLREDNGKGYAVLAEKFQKVEILSLWLVTNVYEDEETGELLAVEDIVRDEVLEFVHLTLASLCVAIAWEIDEVPLAVDEEMVNQQRLARSRGRERQFPALCKHIDKRRFAYVRASDEGVFG